MRTSKHLFTGAFFLLMALFPATSQAQAPARSADRERASKTGGETAIVQALLRDKNSCFYLDAQHYPPIAKELPVGIFDSGTGGLTVLDAIIRFDQFDNETRTWTAKGDGKPDLRSEVFVYLADTANMPYGVCPQKGKTDLLKEHIIKDARFLLGRNYYRTAAAERAQTDKSPPKVIVIACNTATAYGKSDIEHLLDLAGLDIKVIGVIDAGCRGALSRLEKDEDASVGVLATTGTVASKGYVRSLAAQKRAGGYRGNILVVQQAGYGWPGAIDGASEYIKLGADKPRKEYQGPAFHHEQAPIDESLMARYAFQWDHHEMLYSGSRERPDNLQINSVNNYIRYHLVTLLETVRNTQGAPKLKAIILGCTHFPFYQEEIQAILEELYDYQEEGEYVYRPFMVEKIALVDPALDTAKELFEHLEERSLLNESDMRRSEFYISVPNTSNPNIRLEGPGAFTYDYKYGRVAGEIQEYVKRVPFSKANLPAEVLDRLERKAPKVFELMVQFDQHNPKAAFLTEEQKIR